MQTKLMNAIDTYAQALGRVVQAEESGDSDEKIASLHEEKRQARDAVQAMLVAAAPQQVQPITGESLYKVREAFFQKKGREPLADDVSFAKMVVAAFTAPAHPAEGVPAQPLQKFESPRAKILMQAWQEGFAACRDAEYVGEEAENDAFNQSMTLNHCIAEDELHATQPAEGAPAQGGTPGPWRVRKRTNDVGEVLDCFVTAPDCQGRAYDAHILGDDYDSIDLKLADAELTVAAVNAFRAAATHPTQQGLDERTAYEAECFRWLRDEALKVWKKGPVVFMTDADGCPGDGGAWSDNILSGEKLERAIPVAAQAKQGGAA